jgi:hypothetical protein
MNKQYQLIAALAAGLWAAPFTARAAEPVMEAGKLEEMSKEANSPAEHAKAAKQFRLRAESLEAKAKKHEENARKRNSPNPMATKWPAMVRNGTDRESRLAMQARRAAQECYTRAARHVSLAVEGQLAAGGQESGGVVE